MKTALDVIRDHYAASARGDLAGMLAPLSPDVEWIEMAGFPYAGTYRGPDAVTAGVFARIGAEWSEYQAIPDEYVAEGDKVVAFGHYTGTCKATGRSMRVRFVHLWHLEHNRVVRFEQFTDTHAFRQAMRRLPRAAA